MSKARILFSMPTKHHVEIAMDELTGLENLGYECSHFNYAAKAGYDSAFKRVFIILQNALSLVKSSYQFKPDIIYFNSRLERLAGIRDFITIIIVQIFYVKRVKFVIKSHGSDIEVITTPSPLFKLIIMPYLKRTISGWLFLSQEEKIKISELNFFPTDRIFVTKNIVRANQFTKDPNFRSNLHIPEQDIVLLFVGRTIRGKGIFQVIEAFSNLKDDQKATLIIVGDGKDLAEVKEAVNSFANKEKVIFTGFIPEEEVVSYYANADVLVFPTYFPEGFPMALFNSVAAGLAIITTSTRAAKDYLSEPKNCIWVEPKNSGSVLEGLLELYNNRNLLIGMKANNLLMGRQFGIEQVSIELAHTIDLIFYSDNNDKAVKAV